jgi:hypothetical protein
VQIFGLAIKEVVRPSGAGAGAEAGGELAEAFTGEGVAVNR